MIAPWLAVTVATMIAASWTAQRRDSEPEDLALRVLDRPLPEGDLAVIRAHDQPRHHPGHDGDLTADSEGTGRGTAFTVQLRTGNALAEKRARA